MTISIQFFIQGYSDPLRLDRNAGGGGLLVYVRSDIPSSELKSFKFDDDIECICFEINLRGKKWALSSNYRPPSQSQDRILAERLITIVRTTTIFCSLVIAIHLKQIRRSIIS